MKSAHIGAVVLICAAVLTALTAAPAAALDAYSIKLPGNVFRAGTSVAVTISGLYNSPSCSVSFTGPKSTRPIKIRVDNGSAKGRIKSPSAPGTYKLKAACGKAGSALSDPVAIVKPTSPLKATCTVVESAFMLQKFDYAYVAAVVRNDSPELTATDVALAVTYRDPAGNVVATQELRGSGVGPATAVLFTDEFTKAPGATSLTVVSTCKTGIVAPPAQISGVGTWSPDADPSWPYQHFSGQFTNPYTYALDSHSRVSIAFRNPAGGLIGGMIAYPDSFVPANAVGTWTTSSNPGVPAGTSVQFMVNPVEMK